MLFTCFFRELMNILGIMGLIFCIFLPVQHRAQVLFHYCEASLRDLNEGLSKKKHPTFLQITIWLWLIRFHYSKCARWGFPLQRWYSFSHSIVYILKCLLIMFFTEYLIIMFFLILTTTQYRSWTWNRVEHMIAHRITIWCLHSSDTKVSLCAKCSHYVILLIFFLIALE